MSGDASTLLMRDGTAYTGEFHNGEISGNGVKQWSDGKIYQGSFLEGEMHGQGLIKYDTSKYSQKDASYEGQFHLNSREG